MTGTNGNRLRTAPTNSKPSTCGICKSESTTSGSVLGNFFQSLGAVGGVFHLHSGAFFQDTAGQTPVDGRIVDDQHRGHEAPHWAGIQLCC